MQAAKAAALQVLEATRAKLREAERAAEPRVAGERADLAQTLAAGVQAAKAEARSSMLALSEGVGASLDAVEAMEVGLAAARAESLAQPHQVAFHSIAGPLMRVVMSTVGFCARRLNILDNFAPSTRIHDFKKDGHC